MPVLYMCEISTVVKVSNPPFRRLVRVYSLKERMKTKAPALRTPTRIWGNSTFQNACQAVAPQARAASVCSLRYLDMVMRITTNA